MAEHGTSAGYQAHWHGEFVNEPPCEPCKKAHAQYMRQLWRRKYVLGTPSLYVDATGAKRRIRAMQWMGWTALDIAKAAGIKGKKPEGFVYNMVHQKRIHYLNHAKICGAYERLSMDFGPSEHGRKLAKAWKYVPPFAWDDETIDDPKAKPVGVRTNSQEGKCVVCKKEAKNMRREMCQTHYRQWIKKQKEAA